MHREGDGRFSKSIWAHEPILTPEKRVWRAVLTQALEDAESTPIDGETGAEPLEASRARRYLRADSPFEAADLKLVCDFADLPADRVFLWARRQYPLAERLECGSEAAAFLTAEPSVITQKQEPCSRTPQNAASPQVGFLTKTEILELRTKNESCFDVTPQHFGQTQRSRRTAKRRERQCPTRCGRQSIQR